MNLVYLRIAEKFLNVHKFFIYTSYINVEVR